MDPLNLFRVDGMVAVVTGGGTGMFSTSLSLCFLFSLLLFGFTLTSALRSPFTATSYTSELPQLKPHYVFFLNRNLFINPKRLNLALAA
jgi:hypothetical protein